MQQDREVFVVSNYTANGPINDSSSSSDLPIITHNQRDYYVIETESLDNRRVLIPVRSTTPPPSYDELFNDK